MAEEAAFPICCDELEDALRRGALCAVEVAPGQIRVVLPDPDGRTGVALNYCPFCGANQMADEGEG